MLLHLVSIVITLCAVYYVYLRRRPNRFPPGPFRWPIIGNLPQIGMEPYKNLMLMREKYGDIIGVSLGFKRVVFLNEYSVIKEVFGSSAFAARAKFHHFSEPNTGIFKGILFNSGKSWLEQRRFAFSYLQSTLRNGVPIESIILREVQELVDGLLALSGKPATTNNLFNIASLNSLWSIITGERFSLTDSTFKKITEHVTYFSKSVAVQGLFVFYFPIVKMFPRILGFEKFQKHLHPLLDFMQDIIESHKETYQDGVQRDFVDSYLLKISQTEDLNSNFFGKLGESHLRYNLLDLFMAGSDTTAATLNWFVFLLAQHTTVQEKINRTIIQHVGKSRLPNLHDKPKLLYVEATLNEVLRYSSLFPLGVFHETTEDTEFRGYQLPKGTLVGANQYAVHHDPNVWGDPENFRPERFLSEDESELSRPSTFIPFSIGRRVCPGEALARDELFLFAASLFQRFKVDFDPNVPIPPLKHEIGTLLHPVNYEVVFHDLFK